MEILFNEVKSVVEEYKKHNTLIKTNIYQEKERNVFHIDLDCCGSGRRSIMYRNGIKMVEQGNYGNEYVEELIKNLLIIGCKNFNIYYS